MTKKLGPLPLWAWLAILAAAGYLVYKRHQESAGGELSGVEEGFFPTQGIPAAGIETGNTGGVTSAEEFQARQQEAAEGRDIAREERAEERGEAKEAREEGFLERAEIRREAFEKWAAQFARGGGGQGKGKSKHQGKGKAGKGHKQGKGKGAGGGGGAGNQGSGNAGQQHHGNTRNHQPGHTAQTNHQAAVHPAQRARQAHPAGGVGRRR